MFEFAKIYIRSMVLGCAMTCGICYMAVVHPAAVDGSTVTAYIAGIIACVAVDKPVVKE